MRISENEKQIILSSIRSAIPATTPFNVFLYGSRVDESQNGGGIDLLVIFQHVVSRSELVHKVHYVLADMKAHDEIGDQQIDLKAIVSTQKTEPFYQTILQHAVELV